MISFSILLKKISRGVLLTVTAVYLFAGTFGAVAGGGDHSGGHDGMSGHDFGNHNFGDHNSGSRDQGMKPPSESHRDRGDDRNNYFRRPDDRRQDAEGRTGKPRGKDNAAPGTAGNNTIHPIVTNKPAQPSGNASVGTGKDKTPGTPTTTSAPPAPGSAGNNTIHPIVTNNPTQPPANAPAGAAALPPHDPVGNTRPTVGSSPPTVVTVSNGVTTTQIQNGVGGVSVYSDKPGTITVTNGKESTTLSGASVTLSGNVVGVGGGQGVEVGPRNGEGKTVVAVKPPAPASPLPNGGKTDLKGGGDPGVDVLNGVSDFGYGVTHGFAPGAAPPPTTSTIQQQ
jgi:hypothetical protein